MILYVNSKGEIKDVNVTEDETLTSLPISENSDNPFTTWSVAKICCYRVGVIPETITEVVGTEEEGGDITETRETGKYIISMMTPYIDSRIIEHIDNLGRQAEANATSISDTQDALCEASIDTEDRFLDVETALCESSMDTEEKFEEAEAIADARFLELETALCDLSELILNN